MGKLSYIIVEDSGIARDYIRSLMMPHQERFTCVGETGSGKEAIDLIQQQNPKVVFMDIELPDIDGFGVIDAFEKPFFHTLFITGFKEYAVKAVKYAAVDYLVKPFGPKDLQEPLEKIYNHEVGVELRKILNGQLSADKQKFDRIILPLNRSHEMIMLDNMLYIEAKRGNYTVFHLQDGRQLLSTRPLNYYDNLLSGTHFYRIHKSYVVNINKIVSVDYGTGGFLTLFNEERLPIAFRRKSGLIKLLRIRSTPHKIEGIDQQVK